MHPLVHRKGSAPLGAVYIGRPGDWGNPFRLDDPSNPHERRICIHRYATWLSNGGPTTRALIARARRELVGKPLACFCAPAPCHGDILARVAEGMEPLAAFAVLYADRENTR